MLNENAYTTEELIHYAGLDDRYKPLLAERIARDGLPESVTDEEVAELEETIEELRGQVLRSRKQEDWLDDLDEAIEAINEALELSDTRQPAGVLLLKALTSLDRTRNSIAAHAAD